MAKNNLLLIRKKNRIRKKISGSISALRMSVYKSLKALSAQAIDDVNGHTLCFARVLNKNIKASEELVELFSKKLKEKNITKLKFDRNGLKYHGVIKSIANGLREKGIKF